MNTPSVIIPSEQTLQSWIERNIKRMMDEISLDARRQKQLPLRITMHSLALKKFIQILESKNSFFREADGSFKFLTVPVVLNNKLPYGCFVIERWKKGGHWKAE